MYQQRIDRLMECTEADAVFISSPQNQYYFSGFTGGEAYLVVSRREQVLFTDSRYTIQAREQAKTFEVRDVGSGMYDCLRQYDTVGVEEAHVTQAEFRRFSEKLGRPTSDVSSTISELRQIKDKTELNCIRTAARIADVGFAHILPFLRPDAREIDIALELEFFMRKQGAEGLSFETICASGVRSAMPHGVASEKELARGELITLDFGCKYKGYCSDMTRTVVLGHADAEQRRIYETVREAQKRALTAIYAGAPCRSVDAAARDYIASCGYGKQFGHSVGHSVGLDIHEAPSCGPRSDATLQENMLMTVEPGIYIDGFGGVRIEDLTIVTKLGCENLTTSPKELLEL